MLESLWKQAGFGSIEMKKIYAERTFTNFDEYWQWAFNGSQGAQVILSLDN